MPRYLPRLGLQSVVRAASLAPLLLCGAVSAHAATVTVCASGCSQTTIQPAINAAIPGDVILLQDTGVFVATNVLQMKSCPAQNDTCFITIRSGVTSTGTVISTSVYPAANIRIPRTQAQLATIMPGSNNAPAFRTVHVTETGSGCATAPCVGFYWKLQWLNIVANPNLAVSYGGAELIRFGTMNTGADSQDSRAKEPHHLVIDQCLVHGDPLTGQQRGILLAARDSNITNNDVYDIKSQNEGQAIWIENNTGPNLIQNNNLEASAEVVMSGGSIAQMRLNSTVAASPAPTTTSMTLVDAIPDWAYVGQGLSFFSGAVMKYTHITSIAGSTIGIEANGLPDVGGAVNMQLVQRNLTFTKNWVHKPPSWRDPIVGTPQSVNASASNTGGTLATGTYSYRIVARVNTNMAQIARSTASVEVSASILDPAITAGSVTVSWAAVPNAFEYRAYGRSAGGENIRFTVTTAACTGSPSTCTFTDTGAAGTAEAVPTSTGTVWQVKNLLELKKYDTALIEGNVFEYNWLQAQTGDAILFTIANNSVGTNGGDSVVVRNITFRNNIVRHASAFLDMTFHDASGDISDYLRDITISNNLATDISTTNWGSGRNTILITGALGAYSTAYIAGQDGAARVKFDHNTILNDAGMEMYLFDTYKGSPGAVRLCSDCDFTNNIIRRVNYGLRASNPSLTNEGNAAWTFATTGGSDWLSNVVVGASCSLYPGPPAISLCPNETTFQTAFANFAAGDYRVTSLFTTASTTGGAIGADITAITPLTSIALSGDNSGAVSVPPTITTSTLGNATVGSPYSATLQATGGLKPYTWSLATGSALPTGLTLTTAGVLSGTATTATAASFTVRVTGADTGSSTQTLSLNVNETLVPSSRPDRVDYVEIAVFRRDNCDTDINETIRTGDLCFEISTGMVKKATSTSPVVTWVQVGPTVTTPFVSILLIAAAPNASVSWNGATTGITAAGNATRIFGQHDLTGFTQCRLWSRIATGATGPTAMGMYMQYSTDNAATWNDLWGTSPSIDMLTATTGSGVTKTAFTNIVAGAKTDVLLRPVAAITGTLTGQPTVSNTGMNCK